VAVRGVILAGGTGSRFGNATRVMNKHLLPVYNRPMIYYPIDTLRRMGCDDILIVTGGEHIGAFSELLGSRYTYRVQPQAGGVAQALAVAEGYVTDDLFPVILGDNYFQHAPVMPNEPRLHTRRMDHCTDFGVLIGSEIIEKPQIDRPGDVVTGLYVYDQRVFDLIRTLKPSLRGELEITDVNNWYLHNGASAYSVNSHWADMGTPDSLLDLVLWLRDGDLL
jgi:glucose-1-phosphate thymidylyltransferase